jgi:23S rRNA pseudouridine2604 synthase
MQKPKQYSKQNSSEKNNTMNSTINDQKNTVRINKYLADKGYSSRREADEFIKKGRIFINGIPAKLGDRVGPNDKVETRNLGGGMQKNATGKALRYFAYHKPEGMALSSLEQASDTVRELMEKSLFPVGRLEKDMDGLVIFTNDGRVTRRLLNPAADVSLQQKHPQEKEYFVRVEKHFSPSLLNAIERDGLGSVKAEKIDDTEFSVITTGTTPNIRTICGKLNFQVRRLSRTRILNIKLGSLKEDSYRELSGPDLKKFLFLLNLTNQE